MEKEDLKRTMRNLWGFFTIAVWLLGVPMVLKLAYKGTRSAVNEAHAVVFGTATPTPKPAQDNPDKRPISAEQEAVLGEFTVEEWKEIQEIRKAKKGR